MLKRLIYIVILFIACTVYAQEKVTGETILQGANVMQITGDANDVWVATYGRGLYQYNKKTGKLTNYSTSEGNLQQDFFYCVTANRDFVWAGSSEGLFILDRKRNIWTKRRFGKGGEFGNWVRAIVYDKAANVVWIGRFRYLTRLDIPLQRYTDIDMTVGSDIKTNNIKTIKLDGDSLVWFGTETGVHRYDKSMDIENPASRQFFSSKTDQFNGDGDAVSIADMIFEPKKIWFGLDEFVTRELPDFNIGGLYTYNRRALWERMDTRNGFTANGIYCLERTGNVIWASLYSFNKEKKEQTGQGIALVDRVKGTVQMINKDDLELRSDKIISMYFDGESIWLGTEAGILKIRITNDFAFWKK